MEGETEADKGAGGVACIRPVMISAKITMITPMATVKSGFSESRCFLCILIYSSLFTASLLWLAMSDYNAFNPATGYQAKRL